MTTRQYIIAKIAKITAMKNEQLRWGHGMVETIKSYRRSSEITLAEMNYLDEQTEKAKDRFFKECTLAAAALIERDEQAAVERQQNAITAHNARAAAKVEEWAETKRQIAEWAKEWDAEELANSALGTVHSLEAEAVDEIIAEEEAQGDIEAAIAQGIAQGIAEKELKAAAAEYEAAHAKVNGWSILVDEGGPMSYEDRIAIDGLRDKKHAELMKYYAADNRLTAAALAMAKVL